MSSDPTPTDAEQVALCAHADWELAALINGSAPPAGVPHRRPPVEVLVGTIEESRPPRQPGGPFRIFMSLASLRGPVADLRWWLGHELSHVCLGHEDPEVRERTVRSFAVQVTALIGAGVAVGVAVGVGLRVAGYPFRVWSLGVLGVAWIAVAVVLLRASRVAHQTLAEERAADGYAASAIGVAMPAAVRDRIATKEATLRQRLDRPWFSTHPPAAERYRVTQAVLAARFRAGVGPVGGAGGGERRR